MGSPLGPPSLWGVLATVTGLLLPPLALSAPTAILVVPGHLLFAVLVVIGAVIGGWAGRPEGPRAWMLGYLVITLATAAALEVGAELRGAGLGYWGIPWTAVLLWGWLPPVVAGLAGWLGVQRRQRLSRRAVAARRKIRSESEP